MGGAGEEESRGAGLGQAAAADDGARAGDGVIGLERAAAGVERDRAIGGEGGVGPERAAAERQPGAGRAQVGVARYRRAAEDLPIVVAAVGR
jgi:hypothetical protein